MPLRGTGGQESDWEVEKTRSQKTAHHRCCWISSSHCTIRWAPFDYKYCPWL